MQNGRAPGECRASEQAPAAFTAAEADSRYASIVPIKKLRIFALFSQGKTLSQTKRKAFARSGNIHQWQTAFVFGNYFSNSGCLISTTIDRSSASQVPA
jgi:hypothetical protein